METDTKWSGKPMTTVWSHRHKTKPAKGCGFKCEKHKPGDSLCKRVAGCCDMCCKGSQKMSIRMEERLCTLNSERVNMAHTCESFTPYKPDVLGECHIEWLKTRKKGK